MASHKSFRFNVVSIVFLYLDRLSGTSIMLSEVQGVDTDSWDEDWDYHLGQAAP
jgi:hypothetical protein